jgi:hypothetical protein
VLDVQLVGGSRLAKRSPAKRDGIENSDAHNGKKGNGCNAAAWPMSVAVPLGPVKPEYSYSRWSRQN